MQTDYLVFANDTGAYNTYLKHGYLWKKWSMSPKNGDREDMSGEDTGCEVETAVSNDREKAGKS